MTVVITEDKTKTKEYLQKHIGSFPDFPKKGILFRDLNPIYANRKLFDLLIDYMKTEAIQLGSFDYIVGIEARGFILGSALALKLGAGFIPVRKKGKLPGLTNSVAYDLEYGTDVLEIQDNESFKNTRLLVIDDVFATGGTLRAVISLLEKIANKIAFGIALDIGIADIKSLDKDHFVVFNNE